MRYPNDKGAAMTIVIILVIIMAFLATLVTIMSYNQKKLSQSVSGRRAKIYYRAQAGVVEANWRIRENYTVGLVNGGGGASFIDDAYDPQAYSIDTDGDSVNDCTIDIGPKTGGPAGRRAISSVGLDA